MRVVLIQPNVFHSSLATISAWDVPSLGLAYLGAVLEGAKIEVSIIDAHIEQLQLPALLKRVESFNPHIIGIPANGFSAKYALRTIKYLRNKFPKCLYIMGGPFPTADYSYLIRQNYSDICVLGEGEITVVELIDALNNKKPLQDVKGLAYMNGLEF